MEVPRPIPLLAGRDRAFSEVVESLLEAPDSRQLTAITGLAGIGKTALAWTAAHGVASRFRHGVYYSQMTPATQSGSHVPRILEGTMWASGRRPHRSPTFSQVVSNRQCLLVLDRADAIGNITDLFKSPVGCAVLLTSREPLSALKHCRNLPLEPIDSNSALELLMSLIGRDRVRAEYAHAQEIVEAASGMPFALQAVAACLKLRPACDLRAAVSRMHSVATANMDSAPPACRAYDLCFAHLTHAQRSVLLRIALLESTQFEPWMLAALTDDEVDWTSQAIDGLARARLIERAPDAPAGRLIYQVPNQTAAYARFRAASEFSDTDQEAARTRLAHARMHTADKPVPSAYIYSLLDAGELTKALDITRQAIHAIQEDTKGPACDARQLSPGKTDDVATPGSASARLNAAAGSQSMSRVTALFAELHTELCLDDAEMLALEAIELSGTTGPAAAFRCLGRLEARRHRHPQAERHFADALGKARSGGDSAEEIRILRELAIARSQSSQPATAIRPAEEAIALASGADKLRSLIDGALWAHGIALHSSDRPDEADRILLRAAQVAAESGHVLRAAWADHARANVLIDIGRNSRGVDLALRAMDHFVHIKHRYGIARCRLLVAQALYAEGKPHDAALAYEDAIGTLRTCDDKWREAMAMRLLAETLIDAQPRRTAEIARLLGGASTIFRRLGDHAAARSTQAIAGHLEVPG